MGRSPIVAALAEILDRLRFISTLWIPRVLLKRWLSDDTIKEIWATVPLAASAIILIVLPSDTSGTARTAALVLLLVRILEILIVQANVLLFDQYREERQGRQWHPVSPYRILILLVLNYLELVVLFAISNKLLHGLFTGLAIDDWVGALALAFNAMASFGNTPAQAINQTGQALLLVEGVVGAFVTLAVLARFVSLLPVPNGNDSA